MNKILASVFLATSILAFSVSASASTVEPELDAGDPYLVVDLSGGGDLTTSPEVDTSSTSTATPTESVELSTTEEVTSNDGTSLPLDQGGAEEIYTGSEVEVTTTPAPVTPAPTDSVISETASVTPQVQPLAKTGIAETMSIAIALSVVMIGLICYLAIGTRRRITG